jgi:hypothetical protein
VPRCRREGAPRKHTPTRSGGAFGRRGAGATRETRSETAGTREATSEVSSRSSRASFRRVPRDTLDPPRRGIAMRWRKLTLAGVPKEMPASTRDGPSATRVPSSDERRGTNLEPVGGGACCALRGLHTPRSQLRRARSHEWPPGASRGGRTRHAAGRRKRPGRAKWAPVFVGPCFWRDVWKPVSHLFWTARHVWDLSPRKESQNSEKAPNAFGARQKARLRFGCYLAHASSHAHTNASVRASQTPNASHASRAFAGVSGTRRVGRATRSATGESTAERGGRVRFGTTTQSWRPWICSSAR